MIRAPSHCGWWIRTCSVARFDGNARSLEPDTQLSENIVNEALIARVVCQPAHNVAVRMRGDGIDAWRRVHIVLLSCDLDRRYRICRVPARPRQRSPAVFGGLPVSGAGGVRLQAGFSPPRRVAMAPNQKYRKQPHAK